MRYQLAVAVFLAGALCPLALSGQSAAMSQGSSAPGSWVQVEPFRVGPFGLLPLRGTRPVTFPSFFGYPESYPFTYFYPSLWPPLDLQYQQASLIAHGDVAAEVAAQEKEYLTSQMQSLTEEVHSLREQQASRQAAAPPSAEAPSQPSARAESRSQQIFPVTVFVYRDGHEMEVRDYAIFGETLWVFSNQTVRKFPISDFNIPASRQVNEEHGIEFPVSDQHRQ